MKSIVFFNNKGGVGKTTLVCNFAHYLATDRQLNTLVLDLDPQCNTTQLLLNEEDWEAIYQSSATSDNESILAPLKPIRSGDSTLLTENLPARRSERFSADLIPGHPTLSVLEDTFAGSWRDFRGGDPGGARRSSWLRTLNSSLASIYDVVLVDVGPSLGALNRSVLIGCDYFVTPMAPDLFSLFALDNISTWFADWLATYSSARAQSLSKLADLGYQDILPTDLPISHGFVGYTVQQYFTTIRGGERRRILAYDRHRRAIPERAAGLVSLSRFETNDLDLGTVPNMFSMIPLAQSAHAPIMALTKSDGVLGAQVNQQHRYAQQLEAIFSSLADRIVPSAEN